MHCDSYAAAKLYSNSYKWQLEKRQFPTHWKIWILKMFGHLEKKIPFDYVKLLDWTK